MTVDFIIKTKININNKFLFFNINAPGGKMCVYGAANWNFSLNGFTPKCCDNVFNIYSQGSSKSYSIPIRLQCDLQSKQCYNNET